MFVVDIGHLTQNDSGHYKCGLGIINQGLFFDVNLEVIPGEDPWASVEKWEGIISGAMGGLEEECDAVGKMLGPPPSGGKDFW